MCFFIFGHHWAAKLFFSRLPTVFPGVLVSVTIWQRHWNHLNVQESRIPAGTYGGYCLVVRIGLVVGLYNGTYLDCRAGHVGPVLHLSRLAGDCLVQRTRKQEGRRYRSRITAKGASTHRRGAFLFALGPLAGRCVKLHVTCISGYFNTLRIQEPTDTNSPVHPFKLQFWCPRPGQKARAQKKLFNMCIWINAEISSKYWCGQVTENELEWLLIWLPSKQTV